MDNAEVKETRRVLRLVVDHLFAAQGDMGAIHETSGLVDVIHHPKHSLPDFNYVTPRRNTAWVAGSDIEAGIQLLKTYGRPARFVYMEGLFPPFFAKTIRDLSAERDSPILVCRGDPPPQSVPMTSAHVEVADKDRGLEWWRRVWRNPLYDVIKSGAEPLVIAQDSVQPDKLIDLMIYRFGFPIGITRLSIQPENHTGHILALALMREAGSPELYKFLLTSALHLAHERGCEVVFTSNKERRELNREVGFIDAGSLVSYAAQDNRHDYLVQSVLPL